jgi:processive 1,2-diacylglycerol beta-glucosyltransferase
MGNIQAGVDALTRLEPAVHVVAVCGKNARLQSELAQLARSCPGRLTVHGFVSTMPELMAAADVVVTNGAGVTVLEALRAGRPVVAFAPLAGHGTAATAEMVRRNLAVEARRVPDLVKQVQRLRMHPQLVRKMERAGTTWADGRYLRRSVSEIGALYRQRSGGAWPGR